RSPYRPGASHKARSASRSGNSRITQELTTGTRISLVRRPATRSTTSSRKTSCSPRSSAWSSATSSIWCSRSRGSPLRARSTRRRRRKSARSWASSTWCWEGSTSSTSTSPRPTWARSSVGGHMVQSFATISLRFVDTTTAERVLSVAADGEVKSGGGFLKGTSLSRDTEWGIASETIQKASKAVVEKLAGGDYLERVLAAATPAGGVEGKIIKVDGTRAWINLGSLAGIKVGDKFNVFDVGDALIDP